MTTAEIIKLDDPYLDFALARTNGRLAIWDDRAGEPVIYRKARTDDKDKRSPVAWIRIAPLSACSKEDAPDPIRRELYELECVKASLGGLNG